MSKRAGPLCAVILAAGYSSRMEGRLKALLPLGGMTCMERVLAACRDGGFSPLHLVVGHRGEEIAAAAPGPDVRIVPNPKYSEGQLSSLQAGLRSLPDSAVAVLVSPIDYPLVTGDVTKRLAEAFRIEREGKRIFVPTFRGERGRPYLIEKSVVDLFLRLPPGTPGRSVVWENPDSVREVPVETDAILIDLDTPEEYAAILRRLGEGGQTPT